MHNDAWPPTKCLISCTDSFAQPVTIPFWRIVSINGIQWLEPSTSLMVLNWLVQPISAQLKPLLAILATRKNLYLERPQKRWLLGVLVSLAKVCPSNCKACCHYQSVLLLLIAAKGHPHTHVFSSTWCWCWKFDGLPVKRSLFLWPLTGGMILNQCVVGSKQTNWQRPCHFAEQKTICTRD